MSTDRKVIARELLRRLRCQQSLHSFMLNIDVPRSPFTAMCPDEDIAGPAKLLMTTHFAKILEVIQRTMDRPSGRAIIQAPFGSAKSTLLDAVALPWEMGRKPGSRILLLSYGSEVAERQSRLAQNVVQQPAYQAMWPENPKLTRDSAGEWALSNGSELSALGILGSVTSRRASGIAIDDPIAGREEADSELQRARLLNAYQDDVLTRLLPGGWIIMILTRWNEQDIAGTILPEDYDGRSGMVKGRDGLDWEVLSLQAKCERQDDPLGRQLGEYIWPEWFPPSHWQAFENAAGGEAARTWSSLCQQRPTPTGSGRFTEEMFDFYKPGTQPPYLTYVGAGDYAVTEGKNDFTELAVFGIDPQGHLWEVDWWSKQSAPEEGGNATVDMIGRWKTPMWFHEGGVIDKSMSPFINMRMRERQIFTDRRALPSMHDKVAKCTSFQARAASGMVHLRDSANSRRVVNQLIALPAGRYDDAADCCGLIGRALDQFPITREHKPAAPVEQIKPFTENWLHWKPAATGGLREY